MGLYRDYRVYIRVILGLYRDNGKENGNYYSILGLYSLGFWFDVLGPAPFPDSLELEI